MFDYLHYNGVEYQTKDTDRQTLDNYKIAVDQDSGHSFLWVEKYESEWQDDESAMFGGYLRQYNKHWEHCDNYTGGLRFYTIGENKEWIEYLAELKNGLLLTIERVK